MSTAYFDVATGLLRDILHLPEDAVLHDHGDGFIRFRVSHPNLKEGMCSPEYSQVEVQNTTRFDVKFDGWGQK